VRYWIGGCSLKKSTYQRKKILNPEPNVLVLEKISSYSDFILQKWSSVRCDNDLYH